MNKETEILLTDQPKIQRIFYLMPVVVLVFMMMFVMLKHGTYLSSLQNKVGDYGAYGLQIERAKLWEQFTGPYSKYKFFHPGPVYFYYFAGVEKILPRVSSHGAHVYAQFTLNLVLLYTAVFLFIRGTGSGLSGTLLFVFVFLTMQSARDWSLLNTWPPHGILLPFLLTFVAAASLASGHVLSAVYLVIAAVLCAHHQVGTVLPVSLCVSAGMCVYLLQGRYRLRRIYESAGMPTRCSRGWKKEIVILLICLILVGFALYPLAYGHITNRSGNITALVDYFVHSDRDFLGFSRVSILLGRNVIKISGTEPAEASFLVHAVTLIPILLPFLGFFHRNPMIRWLARFTQVAAIVFFISCLRISGYAPSYSFHVYRIFTILAVIIFTVIILEKLGKFTAFRDSPPSLVE